MKNVYIVLMNTGTIPSRLIKNFTRYKYSHVVLSLDDSYKKLYSFGRRKVHNFLNSGLVTYGIESAFFKKFHETECMIYEIKITSKQYKCLEKILDSYEQNINCYHYDIKGLLIRIFYSSPKVRENHYVCSQFVSEVLTKAKICDFGKEPVQVRPYDFTILPNVTKIYEGKLLSLRNIFS